jgi:hypothetical protein
MALTGELSDLSLAELIEFFCNQRKTGRLKVIYSSGPGYFYLQSGSVVHAMIGILRGIDAVYYALTLPNASFTFSPAFEAPEHTINQPWTRLRHCQGCSPLNWTSWNCRMTARRKPKDANDVLRESGPDGLRCCTSTATATR